MNHREELETLIELAHTGNMRRAAESLGVSQSTLSDVTTRLEATYGAPLFSRGRRGSHPTVYGEVVVRAAQQALRILEEAQREIGLIRSSAAGRLSIGAEIGLIEAYLAPVIARGLKRYRRLRYRLHANDTSVLVQELRDRRIEFFLGIQPDVPTRGLELREVGVANVIPVARAGHPLAEAGPVDLREVVRFPVAQGSAPRWLVRRIADAIELGSSARSTLRNAALIVNEFGVIRSVVTLSDAVGFVPREAVESDIERGLFREIVLSPEHRALLEVPLLIATLEDRALPPAAAAMIDELEELLRRAERALSKRSR